MELLDFYADWCGPCKMMVPIVDEFIKAHPEIILRRVNVDTEDALASEYGVSGIPCLVFVKEGEEVAREVGVLPLKKLEKRLEKING